MGRGPSFLFYPGDWLRNANLRRCTLAERGAWIEVMCLMHDSDTYGVLRWKLKEIAAAAGIPKKILVELANKGVIKGADSGPCDAVMFIPTTNRKGNDPVILLPAQDGPVWYSSRMLRDDHIRTVRANSGGGKSAHFAQQNDVTSGSKMPHFAQQNEEQNESKVLQMQKQKQKIALQREDISEVRSSEVGW